ncbi:rhophilin-2-B-like isoform X1 [Argonauta hians]
MELDNLLTDSTNDTKSRSLADPLNQTARGKLQTRRSKLNDEIDKELRLRAGAENLFRATGNKKLKELVAIELSFFNSNIQLLKEELSEMNSSVDIYQHANCIDCVPMVPLGLKETRDVDFTEAIQEFIVDHYSEDGTKYLPSIQELMDIRQSIRTPERNESGVSQMMSYYNHLTNLERRFYPPARNLGVYFHWYDSLTGVPYYQRTVSFEKGSILFNIGALYTQIACKQDRKTKNGVNGAIENFQKAAGSFQYLVKYFNNAPSMDMQLNTLQMLIKLMKAQSVECMYERLQLQRTSVGILNQVKIAKMAAKVSMMYSEAHDTISVEPVKAYVPFSWISMMLVKSQYYKSLAHFYIALALMEQNDSDDVDKLQELVKDLDISSSSPDFQDMATVVPFNSEKRKIQGKAHYRESIVLLEEAINTHDLCKRLRKIDLFQRVLRDTYERALKKFEKLEDEDDFTDLITVPSVIPEPHCNIEDIFPEFGQHPVKDLFHSLGPMNVFSAQYLWSPPRVVHLKKDPKFGFGFSVRGDCPVKINGMELESPAMESLMKAGDYIVAIGNVNTKWSLHDEVVKMVRECGDNLEMYISTPMGENVPKETFSTVQRRRASVSGAIYGASSSSSGGSIRSSGSSSSGTTTNTTITSSSNSRATTGRIHKHKANKRHSHIGINPDHDTNSDHHHHHHDNDEVNFIHQCSNDNTEQQQQHDSITPNNTNNAHTHPNRHTKSRNRLSAPWLYIRKNSTKIFNKFEKKTGQDDLAGR